MLGENRNLYLEGLSVKNFGDIKLNIELIF